MPTSVEVVEKAQQFTPPDQVETLQKYYTSVVSNKRATFGKFWVFASCFWLVTTFTGNRIYWCFAFAPHYASYFSIPRIFRTQRCT